MDLYGSWDATATAESSGTSTPVRATQSDGNDKNAARPPTIEQELEQMGTFVSGMSKNLGSYWGQFRRQSATALKQSQQYATNAAKDITPLLDKAKAELDKIGEQAKASAAAGQAASTSSGPINPDAPSIALSSSISEGTDTHVPSTSTSTSMEKDPSATSSSASASTSVHDAQASATAFFTRLQSQLSTNPNFQSFQHNFQSIQSDLKSKVGSTVDFSKVDLAEASKRYEAAMNSGEKYFKVASKELSDLFGEAVRIVPPEDQAAAAAGGGGYMITSGGRDRSGSLSLEGKNKLADKRKKAAAVAAAGRKETLLHRIRSDPAVLLVDPAQPPPPATTGTSGENNSSEASEGSVHADTREAFAKFCTKVEAEDEGGVEGEAWKRRVQSELANEESGQVLKATYDSIVPSKVPAEAFWTRYFFRVQQIEEDEARRKEILEGAAQQDEEDFSWDMEDDSVSSVAGDTEESDSKGKGKARESAPSTELSRPAAVEGTPKSSSTATLPQAPASSEIDDSWGGEDDDAPSTASNAQAAVSSRGASDTKASTPRNSSEEGTSTTSSYDMVSAGSGSPKVEKKESNATLVASAKKAENEEDEDEDSDWE